MGVYWKTTYTDNNQCGDSLAKQSKKTKAATALLGTHLRKYQSTCKTLAFASSLSNYLQELQCGIISSVHQ